MKLRISSIPQTLDWLLKLQTVPENPAFVRALLNHRDYQFEIRRYGLPSIENLVFYFSRLNSIEPTDIPDLSEERKDALRDKDALWKECISNPQKYFDRYEKLKEILCEANLQSLQRRLQEAFPAAVDIDDADIVSTLSFGPSFGYVFENALHLDLFGIEKYCTMEEIPYIILHEMHHLQIQKLIGNYRSFTEKFTLLEEYIFRFTGEGLAVKFCNNAEGTVSRKMNPSLPANIGIPAMPVLNRHFKEHLELFYDTVKGIRQGTVTEQEIDQQFRTFWWNPKLYPQERTDLEQTPIYSFGNELFGAIYDTFGIDILFDCFYHPQKAIEYFKRAISFDG